jgi:hypothetical protein
MSRDDVGKQPLNDSSHAVVKQEKLFKTAIQDMNAVFEIGLAVRQSRARVWGAGAGARIELVVGAIGEQPIEGDQDEMGEDFLFDTTLGLGVKVFDDEDALAELVKLLDAPSAMVDIDELLERIALRIEQRGAQAKYGVGDFVAEQS